MEHTPKIVSISAHFVTSPSIYHALYGSLLVRCHHVVNKDCRFAAVRTVAVPVVRIHRTSVFGHSSRPAVRIHRTDF